MAPPPGTEQGDPETIGGRTPVFVGTPVPVKSPCDYLEGGRALDEFLTQFPSVRPERAVAASEVTSDTVLAHARTA